MLARRLLQLLAVLIIVTFFTALLVSILPGDPVTTIAPFSDEAQRQQIREDLNLDEPIPVRYWDWLTGFVTGDFGNYYTVQDDRPVWDDVKDAIPVSLQLMVYAQVIALVVAIPVGIFAAYRGGSKTDRAVNTGAFALLAVPNFVLAPILIYYLGIKLGWFPTTGYVPFGENPAEHFKSLFLPAVSIAAGQIAVYMRLLRTDMIATLQDDYILMAKSKGVSPRRVLWVHALRPSSLTLLTVAGLNVGALIGGAVVIEVIFSLPGLGRLLFDAISARQYVAMQSIVALIAIGYVLVNFFVDILYSVLDPRIRHARAAS
jgi:peptide/nickel transport system permease protein